MRITARQLQQINERQLRNFIHSVIINEVGGSERADDIALRGMMAVATDPAARAAAAGAVKGVIDFGKSLISLLADTWLYFKTGQSYIDAIRGLTGKDLTPEHQKVWRAEIAAASLHDFLDKFGTAGLEVGDIINSFLYMGENNWKMAGLCMIAAIPVVGTAIARGRTAGKFALRAGEGAALDAGIKDLKKGLKESKAAGADDVISEIDKIRSDMNGGKADFKPYEAIPDSQKAAVKEVANNPARLRQAYDDLRARTSADPKKYSDADAFNPEVNIKDYPQGPFGIVPEFLTTARSGLGKELLDVWSKHADHNFFQQDVKKVHWLGFSSKENRTAQEAISDFLNNAPAIRTSQISTVGYLEDLNPGPRAGASFRTSPQGSQLQVGIKLKGDVTYATTADAFTTNPSAATRLQGGKFEKIPRASVQSLGSLVQSNQALYPDLYTELQKDLAANSNKYTAKWMEPASISPGASATSVDSAIMLDRASWREPYTNAAVHNEVVLDSWDPEAIVLNTQSATVEEIGQIKALADRRGLPLLDTSGAEIKLSDYQRVDRSVVPNKLGIKKGAYDTSSPDATYDPKTGKTKYTGVKYAEDKIDVPSDREAMYENKRSIESAQVERWARLAGLLVD